MLDGISFDVAPGEFFGIVGRNGSGKSTLLKCLAGIYRADSGEIRVARPAGAVHRARRRLQLRPDRARERRHQRGDDGPQPAPGARALRRTSSSSPSSSEFVDLKLKNYSSGMQVRLAFAVMVESDADVMLIDEVLAVGDAAFQQKCLDVFYRLRDEGKTILLVTHDMGMVERFCHRAMMLRDGRIELHGRPDGGRPALPRRSTSPSTSASTSSASTRPAASIREVWCSDADGAPASTRWPTGSRSRVNALIEAHEHDRRARSSSCGSATATGSRVFAATTADGDRRARRAARRARRSTVTMRARGAAARLRALVRRLRDQARLGRASRSSRCVERAADVLDLRPPRRAGADGHAVSASGPPPARPSRTRWPDARHRDRPLRGPSARSRASWRRLVEPVVADRADEVPDRLLRLGARPAVVGDAAADAVRRPLRGLQRRSSTSAATSRTIRCCC